ncbi:flagellar export chaperone FliS [Thermobacillus sp. ZCTH02-B1]|uniref:flagellar export chaperone FliS n=1 Tax=Thermobacillus sp. ZCTH02-B1 TaxID=1858795 RepID=UPI0025CC93A6|nr:flagellar export chaperone FliS [Thermobacillus sp. ZCTH02-B1]
MATPNLTGYQAYQKSKYETASPHRLILLLYDAAIAKMKQAIELLEAGRTAEARPPILKSQDIVCELLACLNEEQGGEIAQNLKQIYFYVVRQLAMADIRKEAAYVKEALEPIMSLRSAWQEIGKEAGLGLRG